MATDLIRTFLVTWLVLAASICHAETRTIHSFKKLQLSDSFLSEGATFGDFNNDGVMDIVSGPYWYAGPAFTDRHEYYTPRSFDIARYSDNFFAFSYDINHDNWTDIVIIGFPGKEAWWFANPKGKPGNWERHLILKVVDNESPTFADITGDEKPEIVCSSGGQYGYAEMPSGDPTKPWKFQAISPQGGYKKFTHGLGVGDVDGDGRKDLLEKDGWWGNAAASSDDKFWQFHPVKFGGRGGAQMFASDVDGDGDNDVVTSINAHGYGLSWFENVGKQGTEIQFNEQLIMGSKPEQNEFGLAISELHALALVDMDHDGIPDIVTGKRWWAHADKGLGALEPPFLYWFKTSRDGKNVRFIPYRIDANSGVGTQVVAGDINGDKWDDVIVGNKKGTFVFTHVVEQVDRKKWEAAQPTPTTAVKSESSAPSSTTQKARKPKVKEKVSIAPVGGRPVGDEYRYAGLPGEEAAKAMKVPSGFSVTLAATEPDIKQPIAMALDDRGRLWVAEAYSYPVRAPEGKGHDRILIFEDVDGDGKFDKRKVFAENLNLVSGIELGFGGVFVGAAPYLLFIPDKNGDDVPDGKPEILLDGWAYEDTHETLNTFNWGPDGWLYGCHGVFTHSLVGRPGTPDSKRVPLTAGIWRYHPTRKEFEVFAEGTSNPWGIDFDDHGQAFCTACVIPHLYHVIQGGRYVRQAGPHTDPYTYDDISTIADHRHYLGSTPHGGNGRSGDAGGGHAHAGAMIYLGGAWPDEYRHTIFMNNIHGQRVNNDILERQGSGFVGHHGKDFLLTDDLASQMLNLQYGPDGQVYIIDWYDLNACHTRDVDSHDRKNGRIYKVTYGKNSHREVDLNKLGNEQLAELVLEKNDWYVRHSRRILQERAATGKLNLSFRKRLAEIATTNPDETRRLRAMWALHVTGGVPAEIVQKLLSDKHEYVRAWAIQLAVENDHSQLAELLPQFATMAQHDASPVVRLYLASAMQRVPADQRWEIVRHLTAHAEDTQDQNLPLMYWYASEPMAVSNPEKALALALECGTTIPLVRDFMLRRIGSLDADAGIAVLVYGIGKAGDDLERLTIIEGLRSALSGRRRISAPSAWTDIYPKVASSNDANLRTAATSLGAAFGDAAAIDSLRNLVTSPDVEVARRRDALTVLVAAKPPKLAAVLHVLLDEPRLRDVALTGLAAYDDPNTPAKILAVYARLSPTEKRIALSTLGSRRSYGAAMLRAIETQKIPAADLSADLVRQLHNLHDKSIDQSISGVWGQVRNTPAEKAALIDKYRELLKKPKAGSDSQLGRAVFSKTCQQCHVLYGVGAKIGPDLTGANRSDIEYLLANIVDPSAVIAKEYRPTIVETVDGRVITGIVSAEDAKTITLRSATETVTIPKDEIDRRTLSETSMMPDDQLKQFSQHEVTSLFAYLRSREQVPIRATKENASTFFNGKDLAGWSGDSMQWSVQDGQIVGRTNNSSKAAVLTSDMSARDFKLTFDVKLEGETGDCGAQFRMGPLKGTFKLRGYQAGIGPGRWGKLDELTGRGSLWDKPDETFVKRGDWNRYEIEVIGSHIRTSLNGHLVADIEDPAGMRQGVFCLRLQGSNGSETRFRQLHLDVK
jgi:putative membrane-bound dehydrogenase-like protein